MNFEYTVIRSKRRSLEVQVYPNLSVRVRAPLKMTEPIIHSWLKQKEHWIYKQIQRFQKTQFLAQKKQKTVRIWGKEYELIILPGLFESVDWQESRLIFSIMDSEMQLTTVKKWLAEKTQAEFHRYYEVGYQRWLEIYPRTPKPKLALKWMRTRWGSCSTQGGISLNYELLHYPKECLAYVIYHELAHLRYGGHGPRFWGLVNKLMPDYTEAKKKLVEK